MGTPTSKLWYPGHDVIKRGVYVFTCPLCGRVERGDDKFGPACTGPGAFDTHPMEPMTLTERDKRR